MKELRSYCIGLFYALLAAANIRNALRETDWLQFAYLFLAMVLVSYSAHHISKALKSIDTEETE